MGRASGVDGGPPRRCNDRVPPSPPQTGARSQITQPTLRGDRLALPGWMRAVECLGPAVLTGKGCLLGMLDYLGPAAETSLGSVGRVGLFGSGLVDGQGVSAEHVGLFGSGLVDRQKVSVEHVRLFGSGC